VTNVTTRRERARFGELDGRPLRLLVLGVSVVVDIHLPVNSSFWKYAVSRESTTSKNRTVETTGIIAMVEVILFLT